MWDRRDAAATYEQEEETLRMTRAYQHKRILLSRARLKAEAFLLQN